MASLLRKVCRVRCDVRVPVTAYVEVLEGWLAKRGSRDVLALMKPLYNVSWKTAPKHDYMKMYADLVLAYYPWFSIINT